MTRKPITDKVKRLRQRQRSDGGWRIWWEPETDLRALGFAPVELDADRPTWSIREAAKLNKDVDRARASGARVPASGGRTIQALIHHYRGSRTFLKLKARTQDDYSARMRTIEAKWGSWLVTDFSKPVMHTWYETLYGASGPFQALQMLRMASVLFSYAELIGWRPEGSNPCLRLKMEVPRGRSRYASWDEFDALLTAARDLGLPAMACAIALSALQGARQTDVIGARVDGFVEHVPTPGAAPIWIWQLTRSKRGNHGAMALHPEARPLVLDALAAAAEGQDLLLTDDRTGQPFTVDLFEKRWAEVRARAAKACPSILSDRLQFRDLRRTFSVWSRQGGASHEDVGDVLGNSVGRNHQLAGVYMPPTLTSASRAVQSVQRPAGAKRKEG